ncbi:MAG: hypothetical protein ACI8TQ_003271 [Planctomycetota bacterium]|jgi:hypothetical protein
MSSLVSDEEILQISCENCGARLLVEPHLKTSECPYCASTSIVERPLGGTRAEPLFALGFTIGRERARELCLNWIKSRGIFTPPSFRKALPERGRGLYLPAYLYCAVAESEYRCRIGENYTETYTTTDSKGRTVTRTRTVTEYRNLSGRFSSYVRDVMVTASAGISNELLEKVEPFDMRALVRYTPALLSGWIAEEASMSRDDCRELARSEGLSKVGLRLSAMMPGDSHSDLNHQTRLIDEVTDLMLLPIWVFAVRQAEGEPAIQILVNGQTGEVAGIVPRSWVRILLVVFGILAVIGLFVAALMMVVAL